MIKVANIEDKNIKTHCFFIHAFPTCFSSQKDAKEVTVYLLFTIIILNFIHTSWDNFDQPIKVTPTVIKVTLSVIKVTPFGGVTLLIGF